MAEVQQTGSGRSTLRAAEQELERLLQGTDVDARVASELFELADLLESQRSLLRALTNPGRDASDRVQLIQQIIEPSFAPQTTELAAWLVAKHWSKPERLVAAVDHLGIIAILLGSRSRGELHEVGTQLFEIRRLVEDHRDLRIQLSDLSVQNLDRRIELIKELLEGKVLPAALRLTVRAVGTADHGHLLRLLRAYAQIAARLGGLEMVSVSTASPLTEPQRDRLKTIVERQVGKPVILAVAVDPDLIGGFRINYGEEAADSSIRTEITEARRILVR